MQCSGASTHGSMSASPSVCSSSAASSSLSSQPTRLLSSCARVRLNSLPSRRVKYHPCFAVRKPIGHSLLIFFCYSLGTCRLRVCYRSIDFWTRGILPCHTGRLLPPLLAVADTPHIHRNLLTIFLLLHYEHWLSFLVFG